MPERSYRWMATLLEVLIAEYDRDTCVVLLRDASARSDVAPVIIPRLEDAGMTTGFIQTSSGDNLFVAVLGLRLKFPPAEAREKVALNIAMREGRV